MKSWWLADRRGQTFRWRLLYTVGGCLYVTPSATALLNEVLTNCIEVEVCFADSSAEPVTFWHSAYSTTLQGLQIGLINA